VTDDVTDDVTAVLERARAFVAEEAGFAQVTTLDARGFPVARTATAFLADGWAVHLVQRRQHARLRQLQHDPRVLVSWVGTPAPGATNERPHVFDLGLLPPRAVMVRGTARLMPPSWTAAVYLEHVTRQRAAGRDRAPLRSREEAMADLQGVLVVPYRLRLEGFGPGAQAHTVDLAPPDLPPPDLATSDPATPDPATGGSA